MNQAIKTKFKITRPKVQAHKPAPRPAQVINIALSEAVGLDANRWYKVLSAGEIHSQKYSGVWDADLDIYMNQEKAGLIQVHDNFLDAILLNFKNNANETALFIDEDHEKGVAFGTIKDMKIDTYQKNGQRSLFIMPEWNDLGKAAVENKHYLYLSIGISGHLNSKTGAYVFPVANTTSLTNIPVDKDQDVIELSEDRDIQKAITKYVMGKDQDEIELSDGAPTGNNADDQNKNKRGPSMDEILNDLLALKEKIKAAFEGENAEVARAAIGAAIDQLEVELGLATVEEEQEEKAEVEDEKPAEEKPADDKPADDKADQVPAKGETNMSEKEIVLSDRISALEIELSQQKKAVELEKFNAEFLNKKFVKADEPKWRKLFLADKDTTVAILKEMKDVGVLGVKGSESDINLKDIGTNPAEHKKAFDQAVVELSEKEKISIDNAIEKIKLASPDLYLAGMKAHQPNKIKE